MFGTERRLIGLDLGSTAVKLACVRISAKGAQLAGAGSARLPAGAIDETGVADPELVSGCIKEALAEAGIGRWSRQAVCGIPGKSLIVRVLTIPSMDHSELREAVKWEAAQYLPYPVEEGAFDYLELGPGAANGTLEVLSISARKTVIEGIVKSIELAGLEPIALDAIPLALGRVFLAEPGDDELALGNLQAAAAGEAGLAQTVAIADIGAANTEVSIFHRGRLRVSRSIGVGGSRFTAALAERLGVSIDEAERVKIEEAPLLESTEPVESPKGVRYGATAEVAEELGEEIQRSIDYFRAQTHWMPVNHLLLTGAGAKLRGLEHFLADRLTMRVQLAGAAAGGRVAFAEAIAPESVSAASVGLALWEVSEA